MNSTDFKKSTQRIKPLPRGLGEALRPPVGGLGGMPPKTGFFIGTTIKSVPFNLRKL
jgi:hypothetical protein